MASRKENLKALFSNSRTRVILFITSFILIALVVYGIMRLNAPTATPAAPSAELLAAPGGIVAIPGITEVSPEYAHLIREENLRQYQQAQKTGGSAIPTLLRGDIAREPGVGISPDADPGVGFAALAREQDLGAQRSLWKKALQDANCSRDAVEKVLKEGGTLTLVKAVCSCAQLKDNGYGIQALHAVCSCPDLRKAGFNARQFKEAGYDAAQLKACNFDACQLKNANFTAQQLKDATFSDGELKGAGYPQDAIDKASGLPSGITADDVRNAGCSADALDRLRQAGVSAAAVLRISACTPAQLKAGGYTAGNLRNAGVTAAQLRRAGYTPSEMARGGYTPRELLNAGYTPADLAGAGFTPEQIKSGEAGLPPGISADDVRHAGCSKEAIEKEREAGVSAKLIRQYAGCSAKALKSGGFTNQDLANAGFTPQQISDAVAPGDEAIKQAGCDPEKLRKLREEGVSAQKIRDLNACDAKALKDAGFSPEALKDAGFTPEQLANAGFTPEQLRQAGMNPISTIADGRKADCSVDSLRRAREAGVSASTLRATLGCNAKAMKDAGYTARQLHDAGYTPAQMKNAGFTAKQLHDAGFTPTQLKNAGFSAKQLHDAGFTPTQLKNAGYSAKDLKDAGFDRKALQNAGFTNEQLKEAGFEPDPTDVAPPPTEVTEPPTDTIPGVAPPPDVTPPDHPDDAVQAQLQRLMRQQQQQQHDQQFQQQIQQRKSQMTSQANQAIQGWEQVPTQTYAEGEQVQATPMDGTGPGTNGEGGTDAGTLGGNGTQHHSKALVKTGDIIFAVLDTSVNSDHPGPVLATVVSGRFRGAKLIGTFTPVTAHTAKMTLTFNTMSVPGAHGSTSINAVAIDPDTARTALASRVDRHYFYRYGSMFAASFLEGFGNAFQSANTSITIGGTGGGDNITVQEGVDRSTLENAVIGLSTVGKAWGQSAQQNVNRPPTVEIFSGTGIGILFTQDLASL